MMPKIKIVNKILEPIFSKINLHKYFFSNFYVFTYHEISNNPSKFCSINNLNVTPENFSNQILYIKKFFNIISPVDIASPIETCTKPMALITFDDGFQGAVNTGTRIMSEHGVSGVNFLNAGPIINDHYCYSAASNFLALHDKNFIKRIKYLRNNNKFNFFQISRREIDNYIDGRESLIMNIKEFHGPFASIDDLNRPVNSNLFYGNHLLDHINALMHDDEGLRFQYCENERLLSSITNYLPLFSYPFGQPDTCYNNWSNEVIRSCGAKMIFSAKQRLTRVDGDVVHRIPMYDFVNTENNFKTHCFVPAFINLI